jgi:glycosyltransferase involved in cell wall biosynthesis
VARNRARRPIEEQLPEGTVYRMHPWSWAGRKLDVALGFPAFFSPRWRSLIERTIQRVRPHLIIGRDIPLAPTTIWAARRHGVPVLLDVAENYPAMMRVIFESGRQRPADYLIRNPAAVAVVERYALRRADRVLVVVDEMVERLGAMGIPADRVDVVSNTTPRARAEPEPPALRRTKGPADPITLVYLGHLEVVRGLGELVEAVAILRDEGLPVLANVVGKGRDAELFKARARSLALTESEIRFLGYVDRDTALATVLNADIGILPHHWNESWNTTMPNKLFDYMAVGLPVVTSNTRPCERIIRETGAGEVFQAGDSRSLAAAIRRLASPEARRASGAAGRRAVLDRYNWESETRVLLRSVDQAASRSLSGHRAE